MSHENIYITMENSEAVTPSKRSKKLVIPRRKPSIVTEPRKVVFVTPDKTTCVQCTCFPNEDPYRKPKKLNSCQHSPLTLYEIAAKVVDNLKFPEALAWSEEQVADWLAIDVGLSEYRDCILDNHINGTRLLMLEDPSTLPKINIHSFDHIQMISSKVRQIYKTDFVKFARSIGLPPRKPLAHCTWFKSRSGPSWGIRQNWTRCDIMRWMKIILPEPVYMDHWDLVWYQKPDFPKIIFGKIPKKMTEEAIPHYVPTYREVCKEYMVPRKFRFQAGIPEEAQMIWMETKPDPQQQERKEKKVSVKVPKDSRVVPKKITLQGLKGRDLLLAKRKMARPKFLA